MNNRPKGKSDETSRIRMRETTIASIRQKYARFGDAVVQFLVEKSFEQGGLRRVLSRVVWPLPHDDQQMHEALVRFLSSEGVDAFFTRVGSGVKSTDDTATRKRKYEEIEIAMAQAQNYRPTIIPQGNARDEGWQNEWQKMVLHPGSVASEPKPTAKKEPVAKQEGIVEEAKPAAPAGTWDGVERRSGRDRRNQPDRRTGGDRRQKVDIIFNNRRFGPNRRPGIERRSGRDRRKNPPPQNT